MGTEEEESISPAELAAIKEIRTKNAFIAARAEKAILESRLSETEYQNSVLNLYIKYGLKLSDSIDENTGKILRKSEEKNDQA